MGSPSRKQNEKLSDDEMIKTLVMFFFLLLSTNNIYLSSNSTLPVNSIWSPSPDVVAVAPAVDKFWSAF